jgi:hypothetical protein
VENNAPYFAKALFWVHKSSRIFTPFVANTTNCGDLKMAMLVTIGFPLTKLRSLNFS